MKIFYHIYATKDYADLVQQQISRLYKSGLLYITHLKVFVNFDIKDNNLRETKLKILEIISKYTTNAEVIFNKKNEYEYRAILDIWETAQRSKENEQILYFHTKGISKPSEEETAWREYMEYYLIGNWNNCIAKLDIADAVGVNIVANPFAKINNTKIDLQIDKSKIMAMIQGENLLFVPHYSGNFWWSKTDYLKKLNKPTKPKSNRLIDRMKYEVWIGSGDNFIGATMHQNSKAHYKNVIKEEDYK